MTSIDSVQSRDSSDTHALTHLREIQRVGGERSLLTADKKEMNRSDE